MSNQKYILGTHITLEQDRKIMNEYNSLSNSEKDKPFMIEDDKDYINTENTEENLPSDADGNL